MTYPISDRASLVDGDAIEAYVAALFGRVRWQPHHFVGLRGIGEKGTPQEGAFREEEWLQPGLVEDGDALIVSMMHAAALRWAQHEVAAFVVPAVLGRAQGSAAAVELLTAVVVDLDSGDTNQRIDFARQHLGEPTMVVFSGGITDAGAPKMHAYWILEEPTEDVGLVVRLRDELARKIGGDLQFGLGRDGNPLGRAHQPIRYAGSVHGKGGVPHQVTVWTSDAVYDLMDLATRIREMPPSPWAIKDEDAPRKPGLGLEFSPANRFGGAALEALVTDIEEGGEGDRNRWTEFSRVAGHYIHAARVGAMSMEEAKSATLGWMSAHMVPPWPAQRAEAEWHNLVQVDIRRNGPMVVPERQQGLVAPAPEGSSAVPLEHTELGLAAWGVHRWEPTAARERKWLVPGLVQAGKPHLFVASGSAGKTQSSMQLALYLADAQPYLGDHWLGCPVTVPQPGTVVMLTFEDGKDELGIRLRDIDVGGKRIQRAGDRLVIVPAADFGGSFSLVAKDRLGNMGPSPQWLACLDLLAKLPAITGAPIVLVIIDTVNATMHADENSALAVQEYMRAATMVASLPDKPALMLTHHTKKISTERPVTDPDDMLEAVRGSTALINSVRIVIGLWPHPYWKKELENLGEEPAPKKLYYVGVLKGNAPDALTEPKILLRGAAGLLFDVGARRKQAYARRAQESEAWLVKAIEEAAKAGVPYSSARESKDSSRPKNLAARKKELPPPWCLDTAGRDTLATAVDRLLKEGRVVLSPHPSGHPHAPVLDVPGGSFAQRRADSIAQGTYSPPDWNQMTYSPAHGAVVPADTPGLQMTGGAAPESD